MVIRNTYILVFLLAGAAAASGTPLDTLWARIYFNNNGGCNCVAVKSFGDSVLLVGSMGSIGETMLMWLDNQGNFIDTVVVYTPTFADYIRSAVFSSRGTIIISGVVNSNPITTHFVAEISMDGTVRWYHHLVSPAGEMQDITGICETTSGNYVVSGWAQVLLHPGNEIRFWLVWIDSLGQIYNEQVIDVQENAFNLFRYVSATASSDGGVITAGTEGGLSIFLMELDSEGNEMWRRWHWYPEYSLPHLAAVRKMPDEDILLLGQWRSDSNWDFFLLCCDGRGNLRWRASPALPGEEFGYDVIRTIEGRYLVVGEGSWPGTRSVRGVFVASYERSGTLHDIIQFNSPYDAWANAVIQLADSTFIVSGVGDIFHGQGLFYPGFYAARLAADSRIPAPPNHFSLACPRDGDTLASISPMLFAWRPSFDPDPLDTIDYTLHIINDPDTFHVPALDTACSLSDSLIIRLNEGWIPWYVTAHSHRPDTSIRSISEWGFYLSRLDVLSPPLTSVVSEALYTYPNPFNSYVNIVCVIQNAAPIHLIIYDLSGRQVINTILNTGTIGTHVYSWHPGNATSGLYFAQITSEISSHTAKLLYVK